MGECDFLLLQETWKYNEELLDIIDHKLNIDNDLHNIEGNIKIQLNVQSKKLNVIVVE